MAGRTTLEVVVMVPGTLLLLEQMQAALRPEANGALLLRIIGKVSVAR